MIPRERFEKEALELVRRVGNGWEFCNTESRTGAYLVCRNVTRFVVADDDEGLKSYHAPQVGDADGEEGLGDEGAIEDPDECSVIRPADAEAKRVHIYDYSVVYSSTYQVPVLYFQASHLDGRMLTWDEVWADVPSWQRDEGIRWNFITQQEHPVTGVPCYHIHPCETRALMANVSALQGKNSGDDANYLMAWLSAVGPVAGLHIPMTSWLQSAPIRNDQSA